MAAARSCCGTAEHGRRRATRAPATPRATSSSSSTARSSTGRGTSFAPRAGSTAAAGRKRGSSSRRRMRSRAATGRDRSSTPRPTAWRAAAASSAIAEARGHVWQSKLSAAENVKAGAVSAPKPSSSAKRSSRTALPEARRHRALCMLVERPPEGDEWLHEIKYDGYRMVARIERGQARLYLPQRQGVDRSASHRRLGNRRAAGDFRVDRRRSRCVLDPEGRTSFQALAERAGDASTRALAFFAFDLLFCDGDDLRGLR